MAPVDDKNATGAGVPTAPVDLERRLRPVVELLERDAAAVDAGSRVPEEHFTAMADAGLYGVFAPANLGGLELDLQATSLVIESLAATCLTTTFIWIQHFRLLASLLDPSTPTELSSMLPGAIRGAIRGGVALGGLLPGPARLRATREGLAWRLDGEAPWVSGWGMVDLIFVTARTEDDCVISVVIDAKEQPGLVATPVRLAALNASATVRLAFEGLVVAPERFVSEQPYEPGREGPEGLRANGSLALGVARRCCTLIGPSPFDDELLEVRHELEHADHGTIGHARAGASLLATRVARHLAVLRGSRAALFGDVAERSQREAALLLVFASRPAIKQSLLDQTLATTA